jgi:hypothetical protein
MSGPCAGQSLADGSSGANKLAAVEQNQRRQALNWALYRLRNAIAKAKAAQAQAEKLVTAVNDRQKNYDRWYNRLANGGIMGLFGDNGPVPEEEADDYKKEIQQAKDAIKAAAGDAAEVGDDIANLVDLYKGQDAFTAEDLARVTAHLGRPEFDHGVENDMMLKRIGDALNEGKDLPRTQADFMRHELTEADLMDAGMTWDEAHPIAKTAQVGKLNYDVDIIRNPDFGFGPWYQKAADDLLEDPGVE